MLTCAYCGGVLSTTPNNGYRSYACLRKQPSRAAQYHRPVCCLPDLLSPALEEYAWALVADTLLDPDRLREGLAASHEQYATPTGNDRSASPSSTARSTGCAPT